MDDRRSRGAGLPQSISRDRLGPDPAGPDGRAPPLRQ